MNTVEILCQLVLLQHKDLRLFFNFKIILHLKFRKDLVLECQAWEDQDFHRWDRNLQPKSDTVGRHLDQGTFSRCMEALLRIFFPL